MASKYASAFDELLASGRQELDRMTGRRTPAPDAPAPAETTSQKPEAPAGAAVIEGTARGIPFRLRVK